ncbi:CWF19-like protein 1 homolog [Gryllus bimaculatus]|nr:CWF19-like protein 1 homolog [Gryllus bimaculatus]
MADKLKILVCGDVDGKFKTLFTRVENINKKSGPFDFLLCVGNFFGHGDAWEPYSNGSLRVPLPVYVLGPNGEEFVKYYPDITGGELCPNVSYVGKRGVFTGLSGLKMAYVSGKPSSEENENDCTFTKNDVTAVRDICLRSNSNFKGVDILATSGWPQNVMNLDLRQGMRHPNGSPLLSWLASEIKPRYHFCAQEGIFYERRPYRNHSQLGDTPSHATRFIALAKVGNPQKDKWIYALNIDPIDRMKSNVLYQQTTDETECPYGMEMLLQIVRPQSEVKQTQFFYDMDNTNGDFTRRKRHKRDDDFKPKRRPPPVFDQALCWFCLASPEVEKHLIVSIGSEAYLAVAKGALVPDHVLILPIGHHQSSSCVPDNVLKEIEQQKGKIPVIFERNYKTSHLQIQVVPVSSKLLPRLKNEFQEKAEAEGFHLDELPEYAKLSQIAPAGTPYFYVELPDGDKLFHRIQKSFPLQFGRDVLASEYVLNMPDRSDWKDCKVSKEEETTMTNNFRSSFEEFDFTL